MAKIDTNAIDGYAEMTPEQKIAYFENFDYNDNHETIKKLTSENAEWKRKWAENASESAQKAEAEKLAKAEYDKNMSRLAEYEQKEKLIDSGFTAEEAKKIMESGASPSSYAEVFRAREEKLKKSLELGKIKNGTPKSGMSAEDNGNEQDFIRKIANIKYGGTNTLEEIKNKYR